MWKLIIGITVGIALGISGAMLWSSGSSPGNAKPPHQVPFEESHSRNADDAPHPADPDPSVAMPPVMSGDIRIGYQGNDTLIIERMNGDSEELLVVTPERAFVIGSMWANGPLEYRTEMLDDGSELLTAIFRTGSGTGVSSQDALVILFQDNQPPAIAQLWYSGYSMDRQQCCHYANTIRYEVRGNTLTTHFEYGFEKSAFPYTDTVELIPGELVTHRFTEVLDMAYALEDEDDVPAPPPPAPDSLTHRELITEAGDQTKWVNVVLVEDEKRFVLHQFRALQNIYDIAISPDGRYGYVWHDEYRPRKLSIFDLDQRKKLATFVPGVGGHLRWSPGNTICHNYGFGTNSFGYVIYDTAGDTLAEGAATGGSFSPDGGYLATFPSLFADTDPIRIIDTTTGTVIREIAQDEQGRAIEAVTDLRWTDSALVIDYYHNSDVAQERYPEATMNVQIESRIHPR